jgi:hypothetical protein
MYVQSSRWGGVGTTVDVPTCPILPWLGAVLAKSLGSAAQSALAICGVTIPSACSSMVLQDVGKKLAHPSAQPTTRKRRAVHRIFDNHTDSHAFWKYPRGMLKLNGGQEKHREEALRAAQRDDPGHATSCAKETPNTYSMPRRNTCSRMHCMSHPSPMHLSILYICSISNFTARRATLPNTRPFSVPFGTLSTRPLMVRAYISHSIHHIRLHTTQTANQFCSGGQ